MARLKSLRRILKVQDDLRRAAEMRLGALQQRRHSLLQMEQQILDSMNQDDPREIALASMAGDRLRWLARDVQENEAALRICEAELREIVSRKMICERSEKRTRLEEETSAERRASLDLIDAFYARGTSFK